MIPADAKGFMRFDRIDDALKYGEMIANSSFPSDAFKGKVGDVLVAIQFGLELGLAPMQALQNIAVINGRPSLYGDAMLAVCKVGADYEWVEEWIEGDADDMVAHCKAKRVGEPVHEMTFSVMDARRARLWGKAGAWTSNPKRMLQMRARSFCLRDVFPHLLKGMVAVEEAQDYEDLRFKRHVKPHEAIEAKPTLTADQIVHVLQKMIEEHQIPSEEIDEIKKRLGLGEFNELIAQQENAMKLLNYWHKKYGAQS